MRNRGMIGIFLRIKLYVLGDSHRR